MLSRGQFSEYRFDVGRDSMGDTVATALHVPTGGVHTAISIEDGTGENSRTQRDINRYDAPHGVVTEPGGQRRWVDGNFDRADPDKVQWAGDTSHNPQVVRATMGLALREHGRMPVADDNLTPEGAKLSQAMSKKFGIRGHPANPHMEPTLGSVGTDMWGPSASRDIATERNNRMYRMDMANDRSPRARGQARYSQADDLEVSRALSLSTRTPAIRPEKSEQLGLFK